MPVVMPTFGASVSFSTSPTATPSWTSVSPYVRSFSSSRGRSDELGRMQAGTAQILLNNQDRRFDPYNTSSPYSPNVLPRKRMKLEATWAAVTYPIITGYVEKWPQTWNLNGRQAESSITISDGFALFGQSAVSASYPIEFSGARINHVLDSIGWGSGADRSVAAGFAQLQASLLDNTTALEHLLSVADSENGYLFMSKAGAVTFLARRYTAATILYTFGDGAGELKYSDLELDTAPIINDVRLTATGGTEQIGQDATSIAAYFQSSKIEQQYLQLFPNDLQALADWDLYKYKNPTQRVSAMTIMPSRDPTNLWPVVLGLEIGDHVTVKRRPPGTGPVISQESVIEGIDHAAQNSEWQTRFSLSPAEPTANFALVDSAIVGTSVVGY